MVNSTELQKPNIEVEVYNNSKKCDWGEKKKLKSFDFLVPIKLTTTTAACGVGVVKEKKKEKNPRESTKQVKT